MRIKLKMERAKILFVQVYRNHEQLQMTCKYTLIMEFFHNFLREMRWKKNLSLLFFNRIMRFMLPWAPHLSPLLLLSRSPLHSEWYFAWNSARFFELPSPHYPIVDIAKIPNNYHKKCQFVAHFTTKLSIKKFVF